MFYTTDNNNYQTPSSEELSAIHHKHKYIVKGINSSYSITDLQTNEVGVDCHPHTKIAVGLYTDCCMTVPTEKARKNAKWNEFVTIMTQYNKPIQREQSKQKEKSKEIERLKTEITKMKSKQEKHKKQVSTEQNKDKKTNLEKQVITLKHLNIQLRKQIMSSKDQTENRKQCWNIDWRTR